MYHNNNFNASVRSFASGKTTSTRASTLPKYASVESLPIAPPSYSPSSVSTFSRQSDQRPRSSRTVPVYPLTTPTMDEVSPLVILHPISPLGTPPGTRRTASLHATSPLVTGTPLERTDRTPRPLSPLSISPLADFASLPPETTTESASLLTTESFAVELNARSSPHLAPSLVAPSPSHRPSPLRQSSISLNPSSAVPHTMSSPRPSTMAGHSMLDIPRTTSPVNTLEFDILRSSRDADKAKPRKGPVPSPLNTRSAAALPGTECNIHIVQENNKVPKFRVGDFVQVRRWHKKTGTYGPWHSGTVFERVASQVVTTGQKETYYIVSVGHRLDRVLYGAHLGEIAKYNEADVNPPTVAESLIHVESKPYTSGRRDIVYAHVKTQNARNPQAGILTPAYRIGDNADPWKVLLIAGPYQGQECQALMTIPYNKEEVDRARAAGFEVLGDGTNDFLRRYGYVHLDG